MTTEVRAPSIPIYLAGEFVEAGALLEVRNPADGALVATTFQAGPDELERATVAAVEAFEQTKRLPSYARRDALMHVATCIERDADELAVLLSRESGKPIKDGKGEVARGALTFRIAAEEATRINGEWLPLDSAPANKGRHGIVRRYPIGPVAGISPFNFPLNLAAHKVAPAIAAGCSIVLKPPSKDPLSMLRVAGYLAETDLPAGAVSVLPMDRPTGDAMVRDDRFKLLSFTGSPSVGWKMKADAGKKKVVLELGGNAGAVVDETADLDWAVERLVYGSFAYAGQVCISVQRIYVVRDIYDDFERRFVERTQRVKVGDPLDPDTELGPMVDERAVQRTDGWVADALASGARALVRGDADGRWFGPTVLVDVPRDAMICSEEAFAPVVNLFPLDSFADALRDINDSRFGLQCGIFTSSLDHTLLAHDELEMGGIIVND
ncbi:MAG TPA: aldehyde dehydrogenase family protein, partial [Candidatus Limnocylindria bacterium]|nr:aldehyde dehydrogenase family protein [Candidatus Limnocylindria bacterium]